MTVRTSSGPSWKLPSGEPTDDLASCGVEFDILPFGDAVREGDKGNPDENGTVGEAVMVASPIVELND
jgi:hypothetical protein